MAAPFSDPPAGVFPKAMLKASPFPTRSTRLHSRNRAGLILAFGLLAEKQESREDVGCDRRRRRRGRFVGRGRARRSETIGAAARGAIAARGAHPHPAP